MGQITAFQKYIIIIGLGLLIASAFFVRKDNFVYSPARSIDEVVYFRMAFQVQSGLENYNTIPYGKQLSDAGRPLPAYFFQPLFKHPPIFTLFLSLALKVFGFAELSAFYVPVFFSLAMIPLVYCLGALIFNRCVGFLAAVLMSLDPMSIVCSQKIWMESLIAFFVVFSIYAFAKAIKTNTPRLFLASGVLSGLGALTKYTGGISSVIFVAYAILFDRKLFKNGYFLVSLILPVLLLFPWFMWNVSVYGIEFFGMQVNLHSNKKHSTLLLRNFALYIVLGFALFRLMLKVKDDIPSPQKAASHMRVVGGCVVATLFFTAIVKSFNIVHLPETSWSGHTFYGSSHLFYPQRLLEFSLISFFGFLAYFIPLGKLSNEEKLLRLGVLIILVFFTIWSAFQSRYIIAAIPLIILIGTNFLYQLFIKTNAMDSFFARVLARSGILIAATLILFKLVFINEHISFTNDLCYF